MGEENNQIVLIFVLSAAFVALLAILLVLFLVIYQKRIVTQENRLQRLQNERQQSLLEATIEGQERERERLAKDLHDGIGSLLSGLSLHLKFQNNKEDPNSERAMFLAEACNIVEEGIENVRTVSHNLLPTTLERFGLITAMKECVDAINKTEHITINIDTLGSSYPLPKEVSLGLLRIFQELIQNTLKHASASEVHITVHYEVDKVSFTYNDNGQGFEFEDVHIEGIGIKNILSRIQALKGEYTLPQDLPSGFAIEIEVPMHSNTKKL